MFDFFSKTEGTILDIIFPRSCLRCGKGNDFVCRECFKTLQQLSFQMCPICEKAITIAGERCDLCKKTSIYNIDKLIVAGNYDDVFLSKLIHSYKYKFIRELSAPLGDFLLSSLKKWSFPIPDYIVPVPLHTRRLKWRGFNQANLLALHLSENIIPGLIVPTVQTALIRARNTIPQMKIKKYSGRINNVNEAFCFNSDLVENLTAANVLLVDDVCTTGSTIFECARILKNAKPRSITAAVLARQYL